MLILFAGCVKDEVVLDDIQYELTARMEMDAKTRTSLSGLQGEMYYPLWSAGDEIAVFVDGDSAPSKFVLSSGEGATKATFAGSRIGNDYRALYPYSDTAAMENGILYYTLPSVQQYVAGSFGPGCYPMVARGTSEGLDFMNLCSVMKISITGDAALRSITLQAKDETVYLSGTACVDSNYDAYPHLQMLEGGSNSVILDCKGTELAKDCATDFHIVLPAQTYKGGFDIIIDAYTDTIVKSVSSDLEFKRSRIRHLKGMELDAQKPEINYASIPDNEIWYISNSQSVIKVTQGIQFGANIVSNTYEDGIGIIRFDKAVTTINCNGGTMFEQGDDLKELVLPNGIETIVSNPFYLCENLTRFMGKFASLDGRCLIVDGVIRSFAQSGVEEYVTPKEANSIGDMAFYRNVNLKKIVISEGITFIGNEVFFCDPADNSKLEEVYLPSTLKYMGFYVFARCKNIKKFYGSDRFVSVDGYSIFVDNYNGLGKRYLVSFASGAGLTKYIIPNGIEGIENYSIYCAESLTELTIPGTVIDIGTAALEGSYNIERIYGDNVLENRSYIVDNKLIYIVDKGTVRYETPDCVEILGSELFANKRYLEEVVITDNVREVQGYGYLFANSDNLKTVTISARMNSLGYDPFGIEATGSGLDKCKELGVVYLRAILPPHIQYNFPETVQDLYDESLTIYVPNSSLDIYKSNPQWKLWEDNLKGYDYTDLPQPDYYISTDYSQDGTKVELQKASEGNGINIVLLGDGYSDRQIADGSYKADMEFAYRNLFTEEPYKSFKSLFNVSYVNVVSATEGYEHGKTALEGGFGDGTLVFGNDNTCFNYALKVIDPKQMNETLIIVVMNSDKYAGTCYMYYPNNSDTDYGTGPAVAYFPKGKEEAVFAQLLHHEACGHGFSKLADEYAYEYMGAIPTQEVEQTRNQQSLYGWWKNVDFTNDPAQVRWKQFLEDSRYANEGLGVFEGGLTYWSGVWRPTENSIMRHNTGGFNAPSREAVYYRIHKLAYGKDWQYDYEKFVAWDAVNRSSGAAASRTYVLPLKPQPALHSPVVVERHWDSAATNQ